MHFHYDEIGVFNAEKAAKGLVELTNKIKQEIKKDDNESN